MNEILFEVLKAVIIIAIGLICRYLIPWLKENTAIAKNEMAQSLILAAVQYADQTIKKAGAGAEKKAIVTQFLKEQLSAKNISITDEQLDVLIESAVYAMNEARVQA